MEPQRFIGQAVNTDDHRGRYVGRLEDSAPLRDQLTITGELIDELKARLAGFKVPKSVYIVDELPRNAMGKVQKNVLRERYSPR